YCDDLNRVFEFFLCGADAGLFHLGGPRPVTLNQIGQIVNKAGGYDPALLRGCLRREAGPLPPRAGNVTMNSGQLVRLIRGNPFHPWPAAEDLVPTDRQWHHRREPGWPGGPAFLAARVYPPPAGGAAGRA